MTDPDDPRPEKLRQQIKGMEIEADQLAHRTVSEIRRGNVADALKFRDLFFAASQRLKKLYREGAEWILGQRR